MLNLPLRPFLPWSQRVPKVHVVHPYCTSPSSFFIFFFILLPFPFPSMANHPVSFSSFSHFAKVSSPFPKRAMCSFIESSKKSEGQEKEAQPHEADTGFRFSFLLLSHFTFLPQFFPSFEFFLLSQVLIQVLRVLSL